jgi:diguanylate cyclase (GGDEF)-like protein/PAS domain S-box-containing protein
LWTDPLHGLFFGDVVRSVEEALIYEGGIWFYVHVAYSYGLVLLSMFFFIQAFFRSKGLYRQQITAMLIGALVPMFTNLASLAGYIPFPGLDLTPLAFTVTGIFFAIALYRLGLLDIIPVARDSVVEEMSDGMLVLDAQNRILDINPAARTLIGIGDGPAIGKPAPELLSEWSDLVDRFRETLAAQEELQLPNGTTIDLRITPLYSWGETPRGRLIILRDVSERVLIEDELRHVNEQLKRQLAENEALQARLREQAIRDPLTGLFNRRFLEETLAREIAERERDKMPLSVALLDIDEFKTLNDTYGHAVGDRMLQGLAQILQDSIRSGDIVCRFGGEEFVVVMPGASRSTAVVRMDHVRQAFQSLQLDHAGETLSTTLSAGVASYLDDGSNRDELLDAADRAMYLAKQGGRNLVSALESS